MRPPPPPLGGVIVKVPLVVLLPPLMHGLHAIDPAPVCAKMFCMYKFCSVVALATLIVEPRLPVEPPVVVIDPYRLLEPE